MKRTVLLSIVAALGIAAGAAVPSHSYVNTRAAVVVPSSDKIVKSVKGSPDSTCPDNCWT